MLLRHFTSRSHLPAILREGLAPPSAKAWRLHSAAMPPGGFVAVDLLEDEALELPGIGS